MKGLHRNEILAILTSMNVELPSNTRMSDEALDKRLRQALASAQYLTQVLPSPPLNPTKLPEWHPQNNSVYEAIRRGNMQEALLNVAAQMRGVESPLQELYKNVFLDLRQSLMGISQMWDRGARWCVMQDPVADQSAINIRMIDVRELDTQTPVLLVLYLHATRDNPLPGVRWLQARATRDGMIQKVNATVLEQKLMLKVLSINAKLLSSDFVPAKEEDEADFKASFLLPMGPLDFEDLGKLNSDVGCVLCGAKTTSRCAQCQSVSYCGPECQRADWPSHKQACRSLKGGTWRTLRFHNVPPALEGMYMSTLNRFNMQQRPAGPIRKPDNSTPPPNIHGQNIFLMKLQIGYGPAAGGPQAMIYDRQRSFEAYFMEATSPQVFQELKDEMRGPRAKYGGVKMYRWAKRVSDWELSVCLDREPQTEIKW
ncbi:hypothetical protein OBBRIDRAFT_796890 [Obba rivulosa]|uniref:MYND-type domain-containing protein n=1 Tax=Obba rivulosa TaxID=1052685 RepID=A0A8E2AWK4_9APHY|nr:hypothetical protein OBBRIDRAFT_796890 [Obba rivulosa]